LTASRRPWPPEFLSDGSADRRTFNLASMELAADLHDGHSVVRTQLDSVHIGDVITPIDNQSIDDFFSQNRRCIYRLDRTCPARGLGRMC
jgi:hypothetical protein